MTSCRGARGSGGGYEGGVCVYTYLGPIPVVAQRKLTQHREVVILQLKKKESHLKNDDPFL